MHHRTIVEHSYTNFKLIDTDQETGSFYTITQQEVDECRAFYFFTGSLEISCVDANSTMITRTANSFTNYVAEGYGNLLVGATVTVTENCHWMCLCSDSSYIQNTNFLELTSEHTVNANQGLLIIEGTATANDNGNTINLEKYSYMNPREYQFTVNGNAKIIVIDI